LTEILLPRIAPRGRDSRRESLCLTSIRGQAREKLELRTLSWSISKRNRLARSGPPVVSSSLQKRFVDAAPDSHVRGWVYWLWGPGWRRSAARSPRRRFFLRRAKRRYAMFGLSNELRSIPMLMGPRKMRRTWGGITCGLLLVRWRPFWFMRFYACPGPSQNA